MDNKYKFLILLFLGIVICFFLKYLNIIEAYENCDSSKEKVYSKSNSCTESTNKEIQLLNEEYTKELNDLKVRISKIKETIETVEKNHKDIDNAAKVSSGKAEKKDDVVPSEKEVKNKEKNEKRNAKRESKNAGSNYKADRF